MGCGTNMKKAIRISVFLVILGVLLIRIYDIISWKDTSGDYLSATKQLYQTPKDLMDVVFVGSSHCYASVYPDLLWREAGIAAFDMAISGQDKKSAYHAIIEVLKTQSPKVICIDGYALLYEEHGVIGNVYRNLLSMKRSENSNKLIISYMNEEERMDYLLRWPIVHTRYRELKKYDFVPYEPSIYGRGGVLNWASASYAERPVEAQACNEIGELGSSNEEWLNQLVELSEKEDFELVFFVAPFFLTADEQKIINAAGDYLEAKGIPFLDFNMRIEELGLDYTADFMDSNHLNGYGAAKVTSFFQTFLEENFRLEDHRYDERYNLWEQSHQYYCQAEAAFRLSQTFDLFAYMNELKKMENVTYVISLDGTFYDSTLDFQNALGILGIGEEEYERGGKWIFNDSELETYVSNEAREAYVKDLGEATLCINNNLKENIDELKSIMIGKESCRSTYNGLSVVVYDNIQHKVIDKKGYY